MLRKTLGLLLFSGLMAELAGLSSALFTSTATVSANSFTAGTVIIATSPTSALVTFSNMAPGDQVTAPITVTNSGTLQLRYAIADTVTNPDGIGLGAQLTLTIKSNVLTCTNGGFGSSGTKINNAGVTQLGVLPAGTSQNLVGNPSSGQQTGDRILNPSEYEVLCFNVTLPLSTGNSYQNTATTATFTFSAEQTANNP